MSGLQVRVGLEVFLAKPDAGPLDFRDCAQVIDPFTITTSVDHCVEPATLSSYRCHPDSASCNSKHAALRPSPNTSCVPLLCGGCIWQSVEHVSSSLRRVYDPIRCCGAGAFCRS